MKKLFLIITAMTCLPGCSTSNEDVIYSLKFTMVNESISTGLSSEATRYAYDQITSKLSDYRSEYIDGAEWIENVSNGKISKSDKSAMRRFDAAENALESLEDECETIVKSIPASAKGSFTISRVLTLNRFNGGKNTVLEDEDFSVSFGGGNGR